MKQSLSRFAIPFLCLSSVCLAHNGGHQHGHEGDERAHLMEEVGKLSEVTDVSKLEARDGLAWLHGEEKPYSGWVRKTWQVRHKHAPGWHEHSHPKQTRLARFKGGIPAESRWLDEDNLLKKMTMFAEKDSQEEKTWVSSFLKAMNTGVGLFMTLEGRTGNEPLVARYTEWSENGTKKRAAKILEYNKDGYRKEDFTDWHNNGQVSEQGQSWRRGHYNIYGGKLVSFYRNGQKRSKELWDYGKPVTIKVWKTNGEKCPETKVAEGMGTYAWRDKYRGEIYVVHSYMDGLLHGPSIWYQDGEKKAVQNWVKGKRQGTEIKHGHDE